MYVAEKGSGPFLSDRAGLRVIVWSNPAGSSGKDSRLRK